MFAKVEDVSALGTLGFYASILSPWSLRLGFVLTCRTRVVNTQFWAYSTDEQSCSKPGESDGFSAQLVQAPSCCRCGLSCG